MMKHDMISKAMLVMILFLFISSVASVNANPASTADDDDDTTTTTEDEIEHEEDDDDEHEPDHDRDDDGTVWIQTEIMTIKLDSELPSYQYWYTADSNGSFAKFEVSYLMIIEFEDQNGDGVYQPNETLQYAPLEAFFWSLQTGAVTDGEGRNTEVYASYVKGGLTSESWETDWYEHWMPGYDDLEDPEDPEGDPALADEEHESLNLTLFESMTIQFYARIFMNDYNGTVTDDEGVQANYTVAGGIELKVDIEIGNFPYLSNTSKVTILNYLKEDVASSEDVNHHFELQEDDGDNEIESEDISDDLGEEFIDVDDDDDGEDDDVQGIVLVEGSTNTTRGFYSWLDKAVQTLPNGSQIAVDVGASYWADGNALLLFLAYPNFDGGSILHDPSMKLEETASPIIIPAGVFGVPNEIAAGVIVGAVMLAIIAVAIRRR